MKAKVVLQVLLFLIFSGFQLLGASKDRVLVYYFKNVSGESIYEDLTVKIPQYLYHRMKDDIEDKKLYVIDKGDNDIDQYRESGELWNSKVMMKVAEKKKVKEVIFGYFYVKEGKPKIIGKLLYSDIGLVVDINKTDKNYIQFITELEKLEIDKIEKFVDEKNFRAYSPPLEKITDTEKGTFSPVICLSGGPLIPFGEWKDIYTSGIFSEINFLLFPKYDIFPQGFGVNCAYLFLKKKDSESVYRELTTLFVGASTSYLLKMGKFFYGLAPSINTGISISLLKIEEDSYTSFDPYAGCGVTLVIKPAKKMHLGLKSGINTVIYKEKTLYYIFFELGVWIY